MRLKQLSLAIIKPFKSSGIYASKPSLLSRLYIPFYTFKFPFYLKLIPFVFLAILYLFIAAAHILALDSIIGLIEKGIAVADNSVVKVGCLDGFAC